MRSKRLKLLAVSMLAPFAALGVVTAQAGASAAATASPHAFPLALYVSAGASPSGGDQSCASAAYSTIQSAVNAARPGATIVVCQGTYREQVVVTHPVRLIGQGATLDETGVQPTLSVPVPGLGEEAIWAGVIIRASDVTFSGFTVTQAVGEGIFAFSLGTELEHLTISGNSILSDDRGIGGLNTTYFQCEPPDEGDCGEGIHFSGVAYSTVTGNKVDGNAGGILLTDDTGPTDHNLVSGNVVSNNGQDCGITLPGHSPFALNAAGQPQPSVAGVYDNIVRGNVVTGNGTIGHGAGILLANATAGTASYDNTIEFNYIDGNGHSGVTFHAHTIGPNQFEDLSGNEVIGNVIGTNNLTGDNLDGTPYMPHTGILVFSAGTPVSITIVANHISNDVNGIFLSKPVTATGLNSNSFTSVTNTIVTGS